MIDNTVLRRDKKYFGDGEQEGKEIKGIVWWEMEKTNRECEQVIIVGSTVDMYAL